MKEIVLVISLAILTLMAHSQNWSLVWQDEFDGDVLSTDNWEYDLGTGSQFGLVGWGNNESQYYTDSEENVFLADGLLHIKAKQENIGGMNYSSGRIKTLHKQFWTYGKIEAYIKPPTTQGIWPAFWMLPEAGFWPGEIDIMEHIGSMPNTLYGTCHFGTLDNVVSIGGETTLGGNGFPDDFHLYAVEWTPDNIRWFVDGVQFFQIDRTAANPYNEWLFAQDYYLLLNVAVGGNWPGYPDATTVLPQEMLVDYVRVYEYDPTWTNQVTFNVDMSEYSLNTGDEVFLTGEFNNWCSTCAPLTDQGNGVWSTTLSLPPGIHEYKFLVNGWGGTAEAFSESIPCTITTYSNGEVFTNRYVNTIFEDVSTPAVCFNDCDLCPGNVNEGCTDPFASNYISSANVDDGSCLYDIVFRVNMNDETLAGGDVVYVNGTFNGWCGTCSPLSDVNNDGIWERTISLPPGSHEYKFTTNGWLGLIENFDPSLPCVLATYTPDEVFVNRYVNIIAGSNNELGTPCFNSCDNCVQTSIPVTFYVDMAYTEVSTEGLYLIGDFQGWSPGDLEMSHVAYDLYSLQIELQSNTEYSFAFCNGLDLINKENVSGPCSDGGNRILQTNSEEMTLNIVCFENCAGCNGCSDPAFIEYNPYAESGTETCSSPIVQGCTYPDATNFNPAANVDNGSCQFDSSTCVGDLNNDQVINTADLTSLLSNYGASCE